MRQKWVMISLLCMLCLTLLTSQVYAAAPGLSMLKKTQQPASDQGQTGNGNDKEKQNNGNGKSQSNSSDKTEKQNNGKSEDKDCVEDPISSSTTDKINCDPDQIEKPEKDNQGQKKQHLRGTLIAVGENSITVQIGDEIKTFLIGPDTRLVIPTLGNKAQWDKLNKGVNIQIKAVQQEDESLLAVSVNVVPGKPDRFHRVGVVSNYVEGESITIDGSTYKITADTVLLPAGAKVEEGDSVTIISPRDVTGGDLVAKGIVVRKK